MTTPTPPHSAEYLEQRKFAALIETATNGQLRDLIDTLTAERPAAPTWKISIVWQEINRRTR